LYQLRREVQTVQERAEALHALACTQAFPQLLAWSTALHGWACAVQERTTARMAQIGEGLAAWRVTGTALNQPWLLALMAEVYGLGGQTDAGLMLLTEALTLVDKTDERWYEAEIYRLKGEILLVHAAEHRTAAETCFRQACDVARRQQAKSWELRAAMSLARLWQQQGKQAEARALLAPVYGWFTEGFDTADLQDAKVLLETLAG
jgi:predicted ATPase